MTSPILKLLMCVAGKALRGCVPDTNVPDTTHQNLGPLLLEFPAWPGSHALGPTSCVAQAAFSAALPSPVLLREPSAVTRVRGQREHLFQKQNAHAAREAKQAQNQKTCCKAPVGAQGHFQSTDPGSEASTA